MNKIENYATFLAGGNDFEKIINEVKETNDDEEEKQDKDAFQGIGTFLANDLLGPDALDLVDFDKKK